MALECMGFAYFWIESGKELDKGMELFSGIIIFDIVWNMKNIWEVGTTAYSNKCRLHGLHQQ